MTDPGTLIIGAGQGGIQAAVSLREAGYSKSITVLNDENVAPYQRPPLSKAYLSGKTDENGLRLRSAEYYDKVGIDIRNARAASIDRTSQRVHCDDGLSFDYDNLILCTGGRNRKLNIPGIDLSGVVSLRTLQDASNLRGRIDQANDVVVIGAGFIGLEFAAVVATKGASVRVIEAGDRVMARAVSPDVSNFFTRKHIEAGTSFSFGDTVSKLHGRDGRLTSVTTAKGETLPADLVLVGVGLVPNDDLARAAGLATDNGVLVNQHLQSDDPRIFAIGDCAMHPNAFARKTTRLESVQNAVDQGRAVAACIAGMPTVYSAVPWFWSDQGKDKLQIAGIGSASDDFAVSGDVEGGRFSVFRFHNGTLVCVESVNRVADHMVAKALLKSGRLSLITPRDVASPDFNLKVYTTDQVASL